MFGPAFANNLDVSAHGFFDQDVRAVSPPVAQPPLVSAAPTVMSRHPALCGLLSFQHLSKMAVKYTPVASIGPSCSHRCNHRNPSNIFSPPCPDQLPAVEREGMLAAAADLEVELQWSMTLADASLVSVQLDDIEPAQQPAQQQQAQAQQPARATNFMLDPKLEALAASIGLEQVEVAAAAFAAASPAVNAPAGRLFFGAVPAAAQLLPAAAAPAQVLPAPAAVPAPAAAAVQWSCRIVGCGLAFTKIGYRTSQ